MAQKFLASDISRLRVTGYADERGDRDYNLALSRRRAEAVAQYLVASGIDAGQLSVEGRGIYTHVDESGSNLAAGQTSHGRIVQLDWPIDNQGP